MIGELISIGDELTCGKSLDTNSQWLAGQLSDRGVAVRFHSTVGDSLDDIQKVFRVACQRADLVVTTGGLGPTEDDLTRYALAHLANVDLVFDPDSWNRIQELFQARGRTVPEKNRVQANFPRGCQIIPNPHGTAPGIDLDVHGENGKRCRFICFPGVPAEMIEMWNQSIADQIRLATGGRVMMQYSLHCLGAGESEIERLIPAEIMLRGREPLVGITASNATISLRVSATGNSPQQCLEFMQPTIDTLRKTLAPFVYGEQDQSIADIVVAQLKSAQTKLGVVDLGLAGLPQQLLSESDPRGECIPAGILAREPRIAAVLLGIPSEKQSWQDPHGLTEFARAWRARSNLPWTLVIGPIQTDSQVQQQIPYLISDGVHDHLRQIAFVGHPALRQIRAAKLILNSVRKRLVGLEE